MRFTAIDTSAWEELKESIVELTDCFNEHFAPPAELPDLLHNGDVCRILVSEHSSTIGIPPCCPSFKSGINAITNVRMLRNSSPSLPLINKTNYGI